MRIYDNESKRLLTSVTLFLTPAEAKELADDAADLGASPDKHHAHINDNSYKHEITISVYTRGNFSQFHEEAKKFLSDALLEES